MQQLAIADLIPYPEDAFGVHYHDIALIKLQKPGQMNPYARPACLYSNFDISSQKAIATGWGAKAFKLGSSSKLAKVTLDLLEFRLCEDLFHTNVRPRFRVDINDESQLCAGSKDANDEKDTCQVSINNISTIVTNHNNLKPNLLLKMLNDFVFVRFYLLFLMLRCF